MVPYTLISEDHLWLAERPAGPPAAQNQAPRQGWAGKAGGTGKVPRAWLGALKVLGTLFISYGSCLGLSSSLTPLCGLVLMGQSWGPGWVRGEISLPLDRGGLRVKVAFPIRMRAGTTPGLSGLTQRVMLRKHISVDWRVTFPESLYSV